MRSDWKEFTVDELIKDGIIEKPLDGNHGGIHPKSGDFTEKGVPFIMASDLINRRVDYSNCKFISQLQAETLRKGFAKSGDVLLTHKATIGRTAIIQESEYETTILTPQVTYYRVKDGDRLDNHYLFYYFNSRGFQGIFDQWSGGGSTRKYLGITGQLKLPIILPPLPEQKAIAHILGTLDDKIELNRQMNETLEEMAQALFKSWFVDFDPVIDKALAAGNEIPEPLLQKTEKRKSVPDDQKVIHTNPELAAHFPDSFTFTEELGWIPEGWEIGTIDDSTTLIIDHRGKTPSKLGSDWVNNGIPAISAKNIKSGKLVNTESIKFVDEPLYSKWMREKLIAGDIIMTSEAPMGEMYYLPEKTDYVLSQRLYALRAINTLTSTFLYSWLESPVAKQDLESRCTGTTVTGIKQSELRKVVVLKPISQLTNKYHDTVFKFKLKQAANTKESNQLEKIRNILLPKLISGELRVPEAEKIIADHV
ncbi:restriction endonuclease subunit S [Fulvivirga sediminis]|uniref:Restriction endonuclease subunit S n=1 Tax=Fulvivirga sediminis TaxID=2803949 RepID=A0A937F6H2_9BACT|nr:restriction endonuclease subunit S [Fulvivirga sediminis]MBL3657276.1 restriction endonuclease subunit S [Fulvivirga sediminis]